MAGQFGEYLLGQAIKGPPIATVTELLQPFEIVLGHADLARRTEAAPNRAELIEARSGELQVMPADGDQHADQLGSTPTRSAAVPLVEPLQRILQMRGLEQAAEAGERFDRASAADLDRGEKPQPPQMTLQGLGPDRLGPCRLGDQILTRGDGGILVQIDSKRRREIGQSKAEDLASLRHTDAALRPAGNAIAGAIPNTAGVLVNFVRLFHETVLQVLQVSSEHLVINVFGLDPIVRGPVREPAHREVRAVVLHLRPLQSPGRG